MSFESWKYLNLKNQILVNKISNNFSKDSIVEVGNIDEGLVEFKAVQSTDDVWGADAKITIEWKKLKDPSSFHLGKLVKESINAYALINVVCGKKERKWHLSHEMVIWYGNRQQMNRRRFFVSKVVHAIFFCEMTQRIFKIHAICLANSYDFYKKMLDDMIFSIQCHAS